MLRLQIYFKHYAVNICMLKPVKTLHKTALLLHLYNSHSVTVFYLLFMWINLQFITFSSFYCHWSRWCSTHTQLFCQNSRWRDIFVSVISENYNQKSTNLMLLCQASGYCIVPKTQRGFPAISSWHSSIRRTWSRTNRTLSHKTSQLCLVARFANRSR